MLEAEKYEGGGGLVCFGKALIKLEFSAAEVKKTFSRVRRLKKAEPFVIDYTLTNALNFVYFEVCLTAIKYIYT